MADGPPTPPAAAKAGGKGLAKSLKGHSPYVYAGVIAGAVALVFYLRSRQKALAEASPLVTGPDGSSTPVGGSYSGVGDGSFYPGATQGAFLGQSSAPEGSASPIPPTFAEVIAGLATLMPMLGGGGAPVLPADAHLVPTGEVFQQQEAAPAAPAPPPPPPAAPAPAPPVAVSHTAQPNLGPGIFYNPGRNLRYIVQKHANNKNYRHYESHLNKGDWGSGGVIPQ